MATRNVTSKFLKFRDAAKRRRGHSFQQHVDSDTTGLVNSQGRSTWEEASHMLPPRWVETADEIEGDIGDLHRKIDLLNAAHNKRLMVTFDDDRESSQVVEGKLRRIFSKSMKKQAERGAGLSSELNVRLNKQRALATRVQELSRTFRQSQKRYMTRLKGQKEGTGGGDLDVLSTGVDGAIASPSEVDLGFSDRQLEQLEQAEYDVETRDKEIMEISKSIEELNTIFKDLATLVIDQGTVLDRIDYNMEQVVDRVKAGVSELEKAEETQKSGRPLKCIAVLLCVIGILILILYFKWRR